LVDPDDRVLSVTQQCELLGLSRSSYYYEPATETAENLSLMEKIDQEYSIRPVKTILARHDSLGVFLSGDSRWLKAIHVIRSLNAFGGVISGGNRRAA
jgi:hypothetical protein